MEEKKLTDEEIAKALEQCLNRTHAIGCLGCPYFEKDIDCDVERDKYALDLIHRQKAEIERLTKERDLKAKNCRYLLEENSRQKVLIEQMNNAYFDLQKKVEELKKELADLYGRAYQYYNAAKRGGFPFYDEALEPKGKDGKTITFGKFKGEVE